VLLEAEGIVFNRHNILPLSELRWNPDGESWR
jgi:hypothetical protein